MSIINRLKVGSKLLVVPGIMLVLLTGFAAIAYNGLRQQAVALADIYQIRMANIRAVSETATCAQEALGESYQLLMMAVSKSPEKTLNDFSTSLQGRIKKIPEILVPMSSRAIEGNEKALVADVAKRVLTYQKSVADVTDVAVDNALMGLGMMTIAQSQFDGLKKQIDKLLELETRLGNDAYLKAEAASDMVTKSLVVFLAAAIALAIALSLWIEARASELKKANQRAQNKSEQVTSLLNNSGQGFLSFGSDFIIDAEYSRACEDMLGMSPAGRNIAQVFFHADEAKADLFCAITSSVLAESDPSIRESMLSLLPAAIQRGEVLLEAEYKVLGNGHFMVIMTDITEERRMAAMLDNERRHLQLIVMAVSDGRNFFDTIDAFQEFLAHGLPRMLNGTATPQILAKALYREIHTYKGVLNQFSFSNTPKLLHDIETQLSCLLTLGDSLTGQKIAEVVSHATLQNSFDLDLTVLSNALGEEFLAHGESIILTCDQALQLEKLAIRLQRGETVDVSVAEIRTFLNEIGTLRKVPFKDALMGFDGLVRQAAERLEKKVAPIEVNGGSDVWIDPHAYRPFLRSLGHVFRNAVAHGIESPDRRWEAEKDEVGRITCTVAVEGDTIKLSIADDGAGIDLDSLRQRAVAAEIYGAEDVLKVPDDEIVRLIFLDNISTHLEVTQLSGRGVGLAAVFDETKKSGGKVVVKTVAGQGTEFLFTLPLHQVVLGEEACHAC